MSALLGMSSAAVRSAGWVLRRRVTSRSDVGRSQNRQLMRGGRA